MSWILSRGRLNVNTRPHLRRLSASRVYSEFQILTSFITVGRTYIQFIRKKILNLLFDLETYRSFASTCVTDTGV